MSKCYKCGQGYYKHSDYESSEWKEVQRCSNCGDKMEKESDLTKTAKYGGLASVGLTLLGVLYYITTGEKPDWQ